MPTIKERYVLTRDNGPSKSRAIWPEEAFGHLYLNESGRWETNKNFQTVADESDEKGDDSVYEMVGGGDWIPEGTKFYIDVTKVITITYKIDQEKK